MRFRGKLQRDGRHWLAEVPAFDAITQGRTRGEALDMIADWFASMAGQSPRSVRVVNVCSADFEIAAIDTRAMISLLLRRQRQKSGLSLAAVAERLGAKSRNAYARYEQGATVPTVEKLAELLHAIAPDCEILVDLSEAA
jgi:helix-turn-helix protein